MKHHHLPRAPRTPASPASPAARLSAAAALSAALVLALLASTEARQPRPAPSGPQGAAARQQRGPAAPAPAARPRLVLLVVVDQFRADYLERFGDLFAQNGLRRLTSRGASWPNTNYDHMPTYTAPGHATLMTGTWPAENGIIGNLWYDREAGRVVASITDPDDRPAAEGRPAQSRYKLFFGGENEPGASPRRLIASTVGDELRLATAGRSKVIGISSKDRSAILPAGRHATAAYWFSITTGRMVTSSYYFNEPPAWVTRFNEAKPADKYFGRRWEYLLGSDAEYVRRQGAGRARR